MIRPGSKLYAALVAVPDEWGPPRTTVSKRSRNALLGHGLIEHRHGRDPRYVPGSPAPMIDLLRRTPEGRAAIGLREGRIVAVSRAALIELGFDGFAHGSIIKFAALPHESDAEALEKVLAPIGGGGIEIDPDTIAVAMLRHPAAWTRPLTTAGA